METSSLTERITNLSPAKRALLEKRLKENGGASTEHAIIRRADRDLVPLSFAQQRLWFLHQLEPDNPSYNQPKTIRLVGLLDVTSLQKALDHLVARHEVLRTTFASGESSPVQVIADSRAVEMPLIDLRTRADTDRETEAQLLLTETIRRPFDLSHDLMLRVLLLRLGDQEHILLLVTHHIASDGSSTKILWRELANLYQAFTANQPASLEQLPIQYADYAMWQRKWLQGEVLDSQLAYWKNQLAGAPPLLDLSTNLPRPPVQTHRGARQTFVVPRELTESLKAVSRKEDVTLFMTLLAAFQTLLYRYTTQDNIVVGSPIAGRTRTEVEGLIGFFVNTLVLRTNLSGNPSFRDLLTRVREVALGAYAHQDLPFEKLVEELRPERNRSNSPLFQVMFGLQNEPRERLNFTGLTVSPYDIHSNAAKFDLSLSMRERPEGLSGHLQYNTDLFDDATVSRLSRHFQTLLEGIVANPDQNIADLPILTRAERHQLLVEWNDTKTAYPKDKCVHEIFEAQVEKSPDAVAVVFENKKFSYRELNSKANQLAHHLQKLGVGPETLVGLCLERSLEMIVGILGILKAGGAYVPLDPAYPKERLAYMLEDTQAAVLITVEKLRKELFAASSPNESNPTIQNRMTLCLDSDGNEITKQNKKNPSSAVTSKNLAYVIYTSGSTGQPKGVMIEHSSLANYLSWVNNKFSKDNIQLLPTVTELTFDASLKQLFAPLLRGKEAWLIPQKIATEPAALLQELSEKVNVGLNCVPSLWSSMLQLLDSGRASLPPKSLTCLYLGGERLNEELVEKTRITLPHLRIWNLYGPTETTANSSTATISSCDHVTIGRPIANTLIYILDPYLKPVPVGIAGEIHIGGDLLARGYLNRPELTKEKFITNPFVNVPGARLYKTGDLGRYLSDGNIQFLGRIDDQVKIRGFRIELGEIEATLTQHPAVLEAVALVREEVGKIEHGTRMAKDKGENPQSDRQLVTYVVPNPKRSLTPSELRGFLKEKLPNYMVPSAFVFLDTLPLTSNGKLDRKALPAPERTRSNSESVFIAPRDDIEVQLARIWESVLGTQPVGVRDNFFDLGGHSLLAVRLFVEIEKTIGRRLPLAAIFHAPTIEQLAGILRQGKWSESQFTIWSNYPSSVVPFQPKGSKPPLFWFNWGPWDFRLPRYLGSGQPVYGLQHQSQDGHRALYTSIEAMAAHYIQEIRTVQTQGPYFLGGLCIGGMVAFEMAQQLQKQGQEVALLVLLDPSNPRSEKLSSANKSVPNLSSQITWFRNKVYRHLHELAPLGPEEKLSYALVRVNDRIMGLREKTSWFGRRVSCEFFGRPVPPSLRTHYIISIYGRARRAYVPKLYRGRAILFKTQGRYRNGQFSWENLIADGLETQELDTDHDNVFKEPYVRILAEKLNVCLSEAQSSVPERRYSTADSPVQ